MAYNKSKNAVVRMRRYLDDMVAMRTITWVSPNPEVLARRIREALAASELYRDTWPQYIGLKPQFQIRAKQGYVEAKFLMEGLIPVGLPEGGQANVIGGIASVPVPRVIDTMMDLAGIVGTAIELAQKTNELTFPKVSLSYADKLKLYRWTKEDKTGWKFIDQLEEGITLTRRPVGSIYLWEPDEEDQE